jgi:hypothetical protein
MFAKQQSGLLKWSQGREVASAQLIVLHVIIKRLTFELSCAENGLLLNRNSLYYLSVYHIQKFMS